MNIAERATALTNEHPRSEVLARASEVAHRIACMPCDELISGRDVCWLIAAAIASKQINGAPRVIVKVMDDGIEIGDALG